VDVLGEVAAVPQMPRHRVERHDPRRHAAALDGEPLRVRRHVVVAADRHAAALCERVDALLHVESE